jgi:hypothetical protein
MTVLSRITPDRAAVLLYALSHACASLKTAIFYSNRLLYIIPSELDVQARGVLNRQGERADGRRALSARAIVPKLRLGSLSVPRCDGFPHRTTMSQALPCPIRLMLSTNAPTRPFVP